MADLPLVLTVPEVAKALRLSRGSTYEAIRTGEIPSVKSAAGCWSLAKLSSHFSARRRTLPDKAYRRVRRGRRSRERGSVRSVRANSRAGCCCP